MNIARLHLSYPINAAAQLTVAAAAIETARRLGQSVTANVEHTPNGIVVTFDAAPQGVLAPLALGKNDIVLSNIAVQGQG